MKTLPSIETDEQVTDRWMADYFRTQPYDPERVVTWKPSTYRKGVDNICKCHMVDAECHLHAPDDLEDLLCTPNS